MTDKFTDALDEYLDAKAEFDSAKENSDPYRFSYFCHRYIERLEKATDELNAFFKEPTQ